MLEGPRALATFVACGGRLHEVFTDDPTQPSVSDVIDASTMVHMVERRVLDRVSDTQSPQGIVAIGELRSADLEDLASASTVVVLDGVQDPGNVGAIVRVAAAVAADGVVCATGCADPFSPKAVRASAGTLGALQLVTDIDAHDAVRRLGELGFWRVGMTTEGDPDENAWDLSQPLAVVLGGEGAGLTDSVVGELDQQMSIAMADHVESLNVAVTAGVVLYGLLGRRP